MYVLFFFLSALHMCALCTVCVCVLSATLSSSLSPLLIAQIDRKAYASNQIKTREEMQAWPTTNESTHFAYNLHGIPIPSSPMMCQCNASSNTSVNLSLYAGSKRKMYIKIRNMVNYCSVPLQM